MLHADLKARFNACAAVSGDPSSPRLSDDFLPLRSARGERTLSDHQRACRRRSLPVRACVWRGREGERGVRRGGGAWRVVDEEEGCVRGGW